jgi:DNA-binding transcriptional MerR regulator
MTEQELLIHELAERAGISVRTIRYYITEGLLPQPNYQGKYSYYNLHYLDRLDLIRRLKQSYLPLREIREIMNALTDSQVRLKLMEQPSPNPELSSRPGAANAAGRPGEKALQYINQVMENQTRYTTKDTLNPIRPGRAPQPTLPQATHLPTQELLPDSKNGETWQKLILAPGVELHLRQPVAATIKIQVNQFLQAAQSIFHLNF